MIHFKTKLNDVKENKPVKEDLGVYLKLSDIDAMMHTKNKFSLVLKSGFTISIEDEDTFEKVKKTWQTIADKVVKL